MGTVDPGAFCRDVMHEYERQWAAGGSHAVRHPLRLKMERLKDWCAESCSADDFEAKLTAAQSEDDLGASILAEELLPLWQRVRAGGSLPFGSRS